MLILFELLKIPCLSSIYDLAPHDIKSVWSYTKKLIFILDSEPNLDDGNWNNAGRTKTQSKTLLKESQSFCEHNHEAVRE